MKITQHAQSRSKQRGIPPVLMDLLEQFGAEERAANGAVVRFFDKTARNRTKAYVGPLYPAIEQHLDVYVIVGSDGAVVTVGHRYEHIRRH